MIRNLTSGKIVSKDAKTAQNFFDKTFGMLIKKNSGGIIFKTRAGIHTFFMKEPIDVIIVDGARKVIKIKESLPPNRIMIWNPSFDTVIELEQGAVIRSGTKIGDQLDF